MHGRLVHVEGPVRLQQVSEERERDRERGGRVDVLLSTSCWRVCKGPSPGVVHVWM